jgi:tRNA-dihydrouridine synthase
MTHLSAEGLARLRAAASSPAGLARLAKARRVLAADPLAQARRVDALRIALRDPVTRKKLSEAAKLRVWTEAHCKAVSEGLKKYYQTVPGAADRRRRVMDATAREHLRQRMRAKWADPKEKARLLANRDVLSAEQVQQMLAMLRAGTSISETARQWLIRRSSVLYHMERHGLRRARTRLPRQRKRKAAP